jgi:hypothetical protein
LPYTASGDTLGSVQAKSTLSLLCLLLVNLQSAALAEPKTGTFSIQHSQDRIEVSLDGKPYTAFEYNSRWDKPFLYPIRTASGTVISRGYPIEAREGEKQDHPWHRGIWYGHGLINGEDFWREKTDKSTSKLLLVGKPKLGKNDLEATLALHSSKDKKLGTVRERFAFSQHGANILIDTVITISADSGESLKFGDTDDGGFGFRLSDAFAEDHGAELLNSDGLKGTKAIWGKPARWVKYSATVNGRSVGLAVLDHPSNLRHPTRWHARGYSLCSANPFALSAFTNDKSADGSYTLPAGKTLTFHYLVVVHEGELKVDGVEQYFSRFAKGS